MTVEHTRLTRYYAERSDDELREAATAGPASYRPEAWQVIVAELARRGLRVPPTVAPKPSLAEGAIAESRALLGPWSVGMRIALLPAVGAMVVAYRELARFTPVRGLVLAGAVGFGVWILVGVPIDLVRHHSGRKKPPSGRAG